MGERSEYGPGEFCWVDVAVPDVDAAVSFYGDLLGWRHEPLGEEAGGYGFFLNGDRQVAGIGPLMAEGQPPAWLNYVRVEDVEQSARKVAEAGGTLLSELIDLPAGAGREYVCADPHGAVFAIFEAGAHKGAQLVNEPGSWIWDEYTSPDLEAAERFYGNVLGWSLQGSDEAGSEENPYYAWHADAQRWEEGVAGASKGEPAQWLPYLAVDSAEAAVATTTKAGGEVLIEPLEIPVGTMAVIKDPQGAQVGVLEPDFPEVR
jgi:hypothetical protein